jgi:hypothetical protein
MRKSVTTNTFFFLFKITEKKVLVVTDFLFEELKICTLYTYTN